MVEEEIWKQELETDIVIVGYGGAGATAAITAHDNGARVIILEKMPTGGGNTLVSAGVLIDPAGMEAVQYIERLCFGTTEEEIVKTFVEEAIKNKEWINRLGGETELHSTIGGIFYPVCPTPCWPSIPGSEFISQNYHIKRKEGEGEKREWFGNNLWNLLVTNVERRGITVMTNTPAKELVTNGKGEMIGVIAEKAGEQILIKAKRAVILSCGGFEYNGAMKQAFLPCGGSFHALGNPGNTGDGIVMAQKVGAALWHMGAIACPLGFKAPEYESAFDILFFSERFIYVDKGGRRFANEAELEMHEMWRTICFFDSRHACYPRIPTYAIFDEVARKRGPLAQKMGANIDYEWSLDNSKEIARGWISRGKTMRELARNISLDESTLENTVSRYNEFCKAGNDSDFGRSQVSLGPIEEAPYYAIELRPSLLNTMGGPRRDKMSRVLNNEARPIPRLYSAGELGSIWGFLYEAAGNLTECLAFGRIAGQNAAAEKPW